MGCAVTAGAQDPPKRDGNPPAAALRRFTGHTGGVYDLVFSPDGERLYSRGNDEKDDETLRAWDVASGRQTHAIEGLNRPVALSGDGKTLILGGPNDEIVLWDTENLDRPKASVATRDVKALRVLPDGQSCVMVQQLGATAYFDLANGKITKVAPGVRHPTPLGFSPDGEMLAFTRATGSSDPTLAKPRIHFCEAATGKELDALFLAGRQGLILRARFSPDGRLLAAAGYGNQIHAWSIATRQPAFTLTGHNAPRPAIYCLAFSPDGRFLASGGKDRAARIWELSSTPPEEIAVLEGHLSSVTALAFSPEGDRLATGSSDRNIVLWSFWDTVLGRPKVSEPLAEDELKSQWIRLGAGPTAKHQLSAVGVLSQAPQQAVKLVKEKMATYVAEAQLDRILELIKQLDDDRYRVRKEATAALMRLRKNAEPVLRKALDDAVSLEVRFRLRMVLSQGGSGPKLAEHEIRRYRRVVLLLQRLGTPAARQLLDQLATVFPDQDVQRDAQRTLTLMDQRKPAEK